MTEGGHDDASGRSLNGGDVRRAGASVPRAGADLSPVTRIGEATPEASRVAEAVPGSLAARFAERPPRRICIVMLSAIGDAVHVLPVANALKARWPEAEITWVIQPVPYLLVKDHPAIDRFLIYERRRGWAAWRGLRELSAQHPAEGYDLLLGLQVYFKAGLLTAMAPAKVKLGFDRLRARDANWLFTTHRVPARGQRHVQDQYFEFLEELGIDPRPPVWGLELSENEREAQAEFFREVEEPAISVVVGTSKPAKNWTAERYAEVLDRVWERHRLRPILVGGPGVLEREIADGILARCRAPVIDTLGNDLRRLVWLVEGSALVISPDTGPLHIARALERPVVGLFGYTNPRRVGPYGRYADLVVDGYATHPGEAYPISPEYRDGMSRVTVEGVLEKVELAVERYRVDR